MGAKEWRERLRALTPTVGAKVTLLERIPDKTERMNVLQSARGWEEFTITTEHVPGVKGRGCVMLTRVKLDAGSEPEPVPAAIAALRLAEGLEREPTARGHQELEEIPSLRVALGEIEARIAKYQKAAETIRSLLA